MLLGYCVTDCITRPLLRIDDIDLDRAGDVIGGLGGIDARFQIAEELVLRKRRHLIHRKIIHHHHRLVILGPVDRADFRPRERDVADHLLE